MRTTASFQGSIPEIIRNDKQLYRGDLRAYFKIIFNNAKNLQYPYHNFRHMFHVLYLCYQACGFYQDKHFPNNLSKKEMRNLLIAALFHDFDHSGKMGNDDLNIVIALRGLDKYILSEDLECRDEIAHIIQATEFPHKGITENLILPAQIIRDADLGQSLSAAWIQQIIFGLAEEWNVKPVDVLKIQETFHSKLKFYTEWGQQTFPQIDIDAKIQEAKELIELLEAPAATT